MKGETTGEKAVFRRTRTTARKPKRNLSPTPTERSETLFVLGVGLGYGEATGLARIMSGCKHDP